MPDNSARYRYEVAHLLGVLNHNQPTRNDTPLLNPCDLPIRRAWRSGSGGIHLGCIMGVPLYFLVKGTLCCKPPLTKTATHPSFNQDDATFSCSKKQRFFRGGLRLRYRYKAKIKIIIKSMRYKNQKYHY